MYEEYREAGMDGLIPKPIRVEELFAALKATLGEADEEAAASPLPFPRSGRGGPRAAERVVEREGRIC